MSQRSKKSIIIASDHAGYELKSDLIDSLSKQYDVEDFGCDSDKLSVDYPDFAQKVATEIANNPKKIGIIICGSGIGVSIVANRNKKIRAALCLNVEMAKLSRLHNDANILCLGARIVDKKDVDDIVLSFLNTEFEGGRHEKRLSKIC